MQKTELNSVQLPELPGVYFFLGTKKEILYIGKATSLRNRIRSYFSYDLAEKRSVLIEKMVQEAKSIEWTETDSVLEAMILETNLIRSHKPQYNTLNKDDKSYNHLVITNEKFPRVLVVRGKDLTEKYTDQEIKYEFGPFPSGQLFKKALKIVRKLFQFYDTKAPLEQEKSKLAKGKIDFNRQIGLYPERQSKKEYNKTIRHIRLFFQGKKHLLVKELEREMMKLAKNEKFEEAEVIKKRVFALNHIQDIALIKDESRIYRDEKRIRIEAYDIAHLQGEDMVGVMTVIEGGEVSKGEYRKFKINNYEKANDPGALKEVLARRLKHSEWPFPQMIVVDGGTAQKNAAELVLRQSKVVIPVVAVVKDDRHRPTRLIGQKKLIDQHKNSILLANAESHRFAINYLLSHQLFLSPSLLCQPPSITVMTVIEGGEVSKGEYRKFKINNYEKANDPGALKEVLARRLKHSEWPFPQMIVVDGGTAQKNAAELVLRQSKVVIPVVAVVKDDRHRPTRLIGQKKLIDQHKNSILLANAESHRFAINYLLSHQLFLSPSLLCQPPSQTFHFLQASSFLALAL